MERHHFKYKLILVVLVLVLINGGMSLYSIFAFYTPTNAYKDLIKKNTAANHLLSDAHNIVKKDFYSTLSNLKDKQKRKAFFDQTQNMSKTLDRLNESVESQDEILALSSLNRIVDNFVKTCQLALNDSLSMKDKLASYEHANTLFVLLNKNITDYIHYQIRQMELVSKEIDTTMSHLLIMTLSLNIALVIACLAIGLSYVNKISASIIESIKHNQKAADIAEFRATHDALTLLPNRLKIKALINDRIKNKPNESFAVLFLDLDGFKPINDTYGHESGDAILRHVSDKLRYAIRDGDFVSRIGGDEFVVILVSDHKPTAFNIAQRIIQEVSEPLIYNNQSLNVSASMGVSYYPDDAHNFDSLIKLADNAMYEAKKQGKNRLHVNLKVQ